MTSRAATALIFGADGAAYAVWVAHLPVLRARFDLDPGTLAVVLLALSAGSISGSFVGTRAMLARGDALVGRTGILVVAALAFVAQSAPSVPLLMVSAFAFGIALGTTEVAINAIASRVQIAAGRAWMSSFHGCWSAGFFVGASATAALLALHGPDAAGPCALVAAAALAGSFGTRLPSARERSSHAMTHVPRAPRGAIAQLAAIVFFGWLGEGALTDWAPIFETVVVGSSAALAASVSTAYGLCMTAARFGGDAVVERFGARRVLIVSTSCAGIAIVVATMFPTFGTTAVTFALAGAAIANLSPLVFTLGGRYGANAIGSLTSLGYAAFLSGPALLGGAAHVVGLRIAFVLPIVALAISTIFAIRYRSDPTV